MSEASVKPFIWGTATASYQIEGAAAESGRAPRFGMFLPTTAGKIERGETGDIACDRYHRYQEDIALMHELGIPGHSDSRFPGPGCYPKARAG